MNLPTRGLPVFTATLHDQVAIIRDADDLLLVQLGSALDSHEFMLTENAAAHLRDGLTAVLGAYPAGIDKEF